MITHFTYTLPFGKKIPAGKTVEIGDKILSQDGEVIQVTGISTADGKVYVKWLTADNGITAIDLDSVGIVSHKKTKYVIKRAGAMHKSILNFLSGASFMGKLSGIELNLIFANEERISFTIDSDSFISELKNYLSQYGLTVE